MMFLLEKGERADPIYGLQKEYITDEMIEELKKGRRIYIDVNNEYAVVIKYKKGKKNDRHRKTYAVCVDGFGMSAMHSNSNRND